MPLGTTQWPAIFALYLKFPERMDFFSEESSADLKILVNHRKAAVFLAAPKVSTFFTVLVSHPDGRRQPDKLLKKQKNPHRQGSKCSQTEDFSAIKATSYKERTLLEGLRHKRWTDQSV